MKGHEMRSPKDTVWQCPKCWVTHTDTPTTKAVSHRCHIGGLPVDMRLVDPAKVAAAKAAHPTARKGN